MVVGTSYKGRKKEKILAVSTRHKSMKREEKEERLQRLDPFSGVAPLSVEQPETEVSSVDKPEEEAEDENNPF